MEVFFCPGILMLCPGAGLEQNKESSHDLKPVHENDMAHLKLGNLLLSTGPGTWATVYVAQCWACLPWIFYSPN
jgi:hypothetical protein